MSAATLQVATKMMTSNRLIASVRCGKFPKNDDLWRMKVVSTYVVGICCFAVKNERGSDRADMIAKVIAQKN